MYKIQNFNIFFLLFLILSITYLNTLYCVKDAKIEQRSFILKNYQLCD